MTFTEEALFSQRERIVRFCTWMIKDPSVAEDLTQEALIQAWYHQDELRDAASLSSWLSRIAYNQCLMWLRTHHTSTSSLQSPGVQENRDNQHASEPENSLEWADAFDIELELERQELSELLDRALALLPAETRTILIERYIEESSLGEIATRIGIHPNAVAKRLERGKLAFRRILRKELSQEIKPYLLHETDLGWEDTPLWCPSCRQHHLKGKFTVSGQRPELELRCPGCQNHVQANGAHLLKTGKGFQRLFSRLLSAMDSHYRPYLATGVMPCPNDCEPALPLRVSTSDEMFPWESVHLTAREKEVPYLYCRCPICRSGCRNTLESMVLALPGSRDFLSQHKRIRILPFKEIEADGRTVLVTRLESITGNASLEVLSASDTFETLHLFSNGRQEDNTQVEG